MFSVTVDRASGKIVVRMNPEDADELVGALFDVDGENGLPEGVFKMKRSVQEAASTFPRTCDKCGHTEPPTATTPVQVKWGTKWHDTAAKKPKKATKAKGG